MSIAVKEISKRYGSQLAVNKVSFEVHTGEIVGFIGPNGAGKSTTMKMITGTLSPDSGSVKINDLPALEHQKEIRGMIGYLPENNPLYHEMYIREYLQYVAGLYKLNGKEARERISMVIEMTALTREVGKKIGNLSKGYRQRVGLAQALIHDPEILVLDEPTSGLDPNQIVEIREIIRKIGKEKTIVLSTHILSEAEATCDRVVIINRGKIVADGSTDSLKEMAGDKKFIHLTLLNADFKSVDTKLSNIEGVTGVRRIAETDTQLDVCVDCRSSFEVRAAIYQEIKPTDWVVLDFHQKTQTLETIFRELTMESA